MTFPLSPKSSSALNVMTTPRSPTTIHNISPSDKADKDTPPNSMDDLQHRPSSPFIVNVLNDAQDENASPRREMAPFDGIEKISPFKLAQSKADTTRIESSSPLKMLKSRASLSLARAPVPERNPRKMSSPDKRFPVKVCLPTTESRPVSREETVTPKDASKDTGLQKAIQILEDEDSVLDFGLGDTTLDPSDDTIISLPEEQEPESFADETAFSTFSAVPDMTMFARIGHSPAKSALMGQTPARRLATPATSHHIIVDDRDLSPTPRKGFVPGRNEEDNGNTTNLILDFTEQFNGFTSQRQQSPARTNHMSPSRTASELFSFTHSARTPSPAKFRAQPQSPTSRMSNLLDFDIPPAPTPRSMPSITPRELESLKSGFLSEISSLKASLSGKEAEVLSLKTAVGDAEKRVGECMESLREERDLKEQLTIEKEGWEKRGREMESVLRNVKEEILSAERDRESLEGRLAESEARREAAEMMAQEAESKMAGMRASCGPGSEHGINDKPTSTASTGREVEIAVEKVARELHTLYKSKHETKVAALKKSYEGRWDRKVKDLEAKVDELLRENEDLRIGNNATMSGVVPRVPAVDQTEELRAQATKDAQNAKELEARLDGLVEELRIMKHDNADLRLQLEQERVEKGDLVAACDELLQLQSVAPPEPAASNSGVENLRGSVSRASGLRPPSISSASAVGTPRQGHTSRLAKAERSKIGSAQGVRPGSGLGMRSGIMTSIEKMGSYKGRPE